MSEYEFALAIDVGNSRVTAAVARSARDAYASPALYSLNATEHSAPSVVFVDENGELFFGEAAQAMGAAAPERVAREFARDVGDDVPVVVGEHVIGADDLVARLCAWVAAEVSAANGARPGLVAITHPTSWGGHRLSRLRAALERAGIDDPMLITESEASAAQLEATHPRDPGQLIAVYDLGGTRFDARVLRRRAAGRYQPVGEQVCIDDIGGTNFDDALLRHVLAGAGITDPDMDGLAIAEVRGEVMKAKALLSSAGDAAVTFALPSGAASVRITRSEFESMIHADLDRTAEALDLAIESADAQADRLEAIVLTGGSSRIPLVTQRLSERFDVPIVADADPQSSTALGAAFIAREQLRSTAAAPGTALAVSTSAEKAPAPRPVTETRRAGVLAFLRPLLSRPTRSTSPLLLGAAAVFIAVTIVFSSTTAAGTRWPDYVQQAASDLLNLTRPTGLSEEKAAAQPAAVPVSDQAPTNRTNADSGAKSKATPSRKSSRTPSTSTPDTPATRNAGGGPKVEPTSPPPDKTPPSTTPDTTPGTTTPDTTPDTTTPDTTTPDTTPDTTTPDTTTPDPPPPDTTPDTAPPDTPPADNPPTDTPPADDPPTTDPVTVSDPSVSDTGPDDQPTPEQTPGPSSGPA